MKLYDYLRSGQTNLKRAKLRTFLTVFAIVIGTFTLAMTTAFGQGLQQIVDSQLQAYSSPNLVTVRIADSSKTAAPGTVPTYQDGHQTGQDHQLIMTQKDLDTIRSLPGVAAAYPEYQVLSPDYIAYGGGKYQATLDGFYPGDQLQLAAGAEPRPGSSDIVLPYPYVKTFGFSDAHDLIGKTVTLHVQSQASHNQAKDVTYTVSGVMPDTIHIPSSLIAADQLQQLYQYQIGPATSFTSVAVVTHNPITATSDQTLKALLVAHGYAGRSYIDVRNNFQRVLQIVQYGLAGFAGIALLAAAIGIINTLLMAVLERTQEIGLMKALGMRSRGVFTLFISEALTIGLWGGLVGVGLAWALGSVANAILVKGIFKGIAFSHLLLFPWSYMLAIIVGAMVLGILAGTLPALRASRLDPIEALRRE